VRVLVIGAFISAISSTSALASVSIVAKGKWEVRCVDELVSSHNTYYKSVESAVNQPDDCDIIPPLRYEVRHGSTVVDDAVVTTPTIRLSWDFPTLRADGSTLLLSEIKEYRIYESDQLVATVLGNLSFVDLETVIGVKRYQISTVTDDGLEGAKSSILEINI
jgi:hypothetical protein